MLESSVLGGKRFLCKWQSYELWTESIFVKFLCQGIFKNEKWQKMLKWVILTAWNLVLFVDFYKGDSQNQLYIPNIKSEDSEKCVIKFLLWHHLLGVHFHWKLSFFSTTTKTKQTFKFWSLETNFEILEISILLASWCQWARTFHPSNNLLVWPNNKTLSSVKVHNTLF